MNVLKACLPFSFCLNIDTIGCYKSNHFQYMGFFFCFERNMGIVIFSRMHEWTEFCIVLEIKYWNGYDDDVNDSLISKIVTLIYNR